MHRAINSQSDCLTERFFIKSKHK